MTENIDAPAIKVWDEINIKALSDALTVALKSQIGGDLRVSLTTLDHTAREQHNDKIILQFLVEDKDLWTRGWRLDDYDE